MHLLLGFSHQTGVRVKWRKFRTIVAGICLAIAGLLLIIAAHWGQFG